MDQAYSFSCDPSDLLVREATGTYRLANAEEVLHAARRVLGRRVRRGAMMDTPGLVADYLRLRLGEREHEVFAVLFLDARLRLVQYREMFRGSLTTTTVHPREVAKEALTLGAAAVIVAHNHPSGDCEPSRADIALTETLKAALGLIDVRVLDHVIVAAERVMSFSARGLL